MKPGDAIELITKGISANAPQRWADLGCGSGTFTAALSSLLLPGSQIFAVDKQHQVFPENHQVIINFIQADFEKDMLPLSGLDGILMANSLHFTQNKIQLIRKLETYFISNPTFLIVEYDTNSGNRWVPFPLAFQNLKDLFKELDYATINKIAEHPSVYNDAFIYSALIQR
jgi:trans-aconitate methyltransferase